MMVVLFDIINFFEIPLCPVPVLSKLVTMNNNDQQEGQHTISAVMKNHSETHLFLPGGGARACPV